MATTCLWKIDQRLDHVVSYTTNKEKTKKENYKDTKSVIEKTIEYATNEDKTEKQYYVTGINCEPNIAVKQMMDTKRKFNKEKDSPNNKIIAFHAYQSFEEGELTPDTAHEIGIRLAEEMWGDRFEVVVSTHLNTKHIHNHFVINSVSFMDGKKYYSNYENTALLMKTSDDLCDEYGLKVLKKEECKKGSVDFDYYYKKKIQKSEYYTIVKEDIDYALKMAWTYKQFISNLKNMGYEFYIRADKISIRRYPNKRNIRIERVFGEEYSIDKIKEKIYSNFLPFETKPLYKIFEVKKVYNGKIKNRVKPKGFKALYLYYGYLLKIYPKNKPNQRLTYEMRKEVRKMEQYSNENRFLCKYNITNYDELNSCKIDLNMNLKDLIRQRNNLYYNRKNTAKIENKDDISERIEAVSSNIVKVRNEIKLCDVIAVKTRKMLEQIKEMKEREKVEKEQKMKSKNRRYER